MTTVFVNNLERVLGPDRITGAGACKVAEVSQRFLWYPYEVVVLASPPDQAFADYAASLGFAPRIVVPDRIDLRSLSILDGFGDPQLRSVINGATVESYIRDPKLHALVTSMGGAYAGGHPGDTTEKANDKSHYAHYANGVVDLPEGVVLKGTAAIADEVSRRLGQGKGVFVRLALSGGGLGNRIFRPSEHAGLAHTSICRLLEGADQQAWEQGHALVENIVPLMWSPGVAFHTEEGHAFDFLQVTTDGSYVGAWSPVPRWVCSAAQLKDVGSQLAKRLRAEGFYGWADTDLGVTPDGRLVGFEINGRMDGVRHGIEIGQKLFGPWQTWREQAIVTRSMDHVELSRPLSFDKLHDHLHAAGLLATPDHPMGVVITIPPADKTAGLQVFGSSYRGVQHTYRQVLDLVGDQRGNREDHPLA